MPQSRVIFRALATSAALAATTLTATAADAEPAPLGVLHLSVTHQGTHQALGRTTTAQLTCDPDGGNHPHAGAACDELRPVQGDINALRPTPGMCPQYFEPVAAQADGYWAERPIHYTATYPNGCVLGRYTHQVFEF